MSKVDTRGRAPIYLRITIKGGRAEISVKRRILPSKWNPQSQRMDDRTHTVKELNIYLDSLLADVYRHHREMIQEDLDITLIFRSIS